MPSVRPGLTVVAATLTLAVLAVASAPTVSAQSNVAILRQVRGVLTDENGNRIGRQWITAVASGVQPEGSEPLIQKRVQRLVDGAGEFTIPLPDGYYRLSVWTDWGGACAMKGYEPRAERPNAITVAGRAVGGVTLVLGGARLDEPRWLPCEIAEGPAVTELRPGINFAGWTEAGAEVATLFEAIPELDAASAWDADEGRYRRAARDGSGDLRTLTPGMGLRLEIGGAEPVTWTRPAPASGGLVPLREGRNLVAWAGRDGIAASEAFAGLGDALVEGWTGNEDAEERESYAPNAPANALRTLARGGAYWVEVSAPREWWQFAPRAVFISTFPPARRAELRRAIDRVVAFFIERFAIAVPGLSVQFDDARTGRSCGTYGSGVIYLQERCFGALAHEYTHAIQHHLRMRDRGGRMRGAAAPGVPTWITEGMADYWSWIYRDAIGERPLDRYFSGVVVPAARRTAATLPGIETPDTFASGDRSAHYSLSHLAIHSLVSLTSEETLFAYYRTLSDGTDWRDTFREVFGLDVDRFYETFAERRAREFPPYARVAGSVRGPGGEPLEGVRVRGDRSGADGENWRAVTDPDGAFGRPVRPGSYRVSFTNAPDDDCHFGWYDGDADLTARGGEATPVVVDDVDVAGIDVRLPAAPAELASTLCARVEGVVLGPNGAPLSGIEATLFRADGLLEGGWTDDDGAFSVVVPDGSYELRLYDDSCPLGLYDGDGERWDGQGPSPAITVADVADVTGIVIRLAGTPEALTRGRC